MLSIIIPVLNQIEYTKQILREIKDKTVWDYEILLLISWYDTETESIMKDYTDIHYCVLDKNEWVNWAWNTGVKKAQWEYVAIINNDLLLCPEWNKLLVEWLSDCHLTFPAYTTWENPSNNIKYEHISKNNICWRCYVMRKADRQEIPEEIKIRYWDNFIYEYLNKDIKCVKDCVIHHFESKTVLGEEFADKINARILEDKKARFKMYQDKCTKE